MFTAIGLQIVAVVGLAGCAWLAVDGTSATSVLLGGAAAVIPNGLFALRLAAHRNRSPESYPVVFFLGEFAKIGLTIALLAAVVRWHPEVRPLALLLGLIAALKAPLFVPLVWRDRDAPADEGFSQVAPDAGADRPIRDGRTGVRVSPQEMN